MSFLSQLGLAIGRKPEMEKMPVIDFLSLPQLDFSFSSSTQEGGLWFLQVEEWERRGKGFFLCSGLRISTTGECLKSTCSGLSSCWCRCFGGFGSHTRNIPVHSHCKMMQISLVGPLWFFLWSWDLHCSSFCWAHAVSLDSHLGRIRISPWVAFSPVEL